MKTMQFQRAETSVPLKQFIRRTRGVMQIIEIQYKDIVLLNAELKKRNLRYHVRYRIIMDWRMNYDSI